MYLKFAKKKLASENDIKLDIVNVIIKFKFA
jgi:hypothetical protein